MPEYASDFFPFLFSPLQVLKVVREANHMTLLGEAVAPSFHALKGKLGGSSRSSKLYILCTHTTLMGCLNKFWMGIKQFFF